MLSYVFQTFLKKQNLINPEMYSKYLNRRILL